MKVSASARATEPTSIAMRLFARTRDWQPQIMSIAVAITAFLLSTAPLDSQLTASGCARAQARVAVGVSHGISRDPSGKRADRQAKREARDAKKKEHATRASKSDERSLAKAKSAKRSSDSQVNLGDNDPLDGL
jgi:hypothetical protein